MIAVKYFDTDKGQWADLTGNTGEGLTIGASGWDVEAPSAIVYWGNILGDISGQTDLKNALDNKLEVVTNSDISGFINANKIGTGIISNTEYGYLSGVTSAIQPQINSKLSAVTNADISGFINANKIGTGIVSNAEYAYLSGVTSAIQPQINGKLSIVTNADISGFINANKISAGEVSNTEFGYLSGVISAIQPQIDSKLQKELGPYEMWANNTGTLAESTGEAFRYTDELTYSGTITWTGTTAPSGSTTHTYQWQRVGSLVVLRINLHYATAGTSLTAVTMSLPTDCPPPRTPNGFSGTSSVLFNGSAHMSNALTASANVHRGHLRTNSNNTGYELHIVTGTAGNYRYAEITMNYFVE